MYTSEPRVEPNNSTSENALVAWEAALHLGITPELLFYYTSRGFQRRPGEKRRLLTCQVNGSTGFSVSELDAFDNYLREPWAEIGETRRDPPQKVLANLQAECGGGCLRCGSGIAVETAHIEPCKCSFKTFTPVNPSKLGGVTVASCQWLASHWGDEVSSSSYSKQGGAVWVAICGAL